jgi:hypothetical protein
MGENYKPEGFIVQSVGNFAFAPTDYSASVAFDGDWGFIQRAGGPAGGHGA